MTDSGRAPSFPERLVASPSRRRWAEAFNGLNFELLTVAGLFLLTATFGREFSKIELGFSWLHPTEVMIAVAATVAVIRLGPSAALNRIRATGALIPLVALWLVGAVAAIRGLQDWGFSLVLHDIGLVEYSVIVPLLALVVANRQQLLWLVKLLALGGLLAVLVQVLNYWTPDEWELGADLGLIEVASGMYIGMYVAWVISRVAAGLDVARWHYLVAVLGVAFVVIGASRAAWLGLLAALVIALTLAPRDTRLLTAIVAAAVVVLGAGFSIPAERLNPGGGDTPTVINEVGASLDSAAESGQGSNTAWRVAFWRFLIEQSAEQPVIGAGFGAPSNFTWSGIPYDSRTGDPNNSFDVTAPHNSFVNLLYRTGVVGLLAVVALVVLAAWRLVPVASRSKGETRAVSIWLLAMVALTCAVASFAVALEGPFLGIFFWAALGLALLAPPLLSEPRGHEAAA
jgi:O-antigen ligase